MPENSVSFYRVNLPEDLIQHDNDLDLRVYVTLCILDSSRGKDVFELPGREAMAKYCHCGTKQLAASYARLEKLGWMKTMDIPGKKRRRRILLRILKDQTTDTWGEQFEMEGKSEKWKLVAKPGGTVHTLHNIYHKSPPPSFPADLVKLHTSCKIQDQTGYTLADFSLVDLWRMSGNPSTDDLEKAIRGVELYDKPREGRIYDIIAVFSSWFKQNSEGDCMGELKPRRHKSVSTPAVPRSAMMKVTRTQQIEQMKQRCPIKPDSHHDAESVDRICMYLNDRREVERGIMPVSMLPLLCLERVDDIHSELKDGVDQLIRVAPGYWYPQWKDPKSLSIAPPTTESKSSLPSVSDRQSNA